MDSLLAAGQPVPAAFDSLDAFTPFGAVYRYEDYDSPIAFHRQEPRDLLRSLRSWCEARIESRRVTPGGSA